MSALQLWCLHGAEAVRRPKAIICPVQHAACCGSQALAPAPRHPSPLLPSRSNLQGGMPGAERLRDSQPLADLVAKQKAADKFHAAICATPAVAFEPQGAS